MMGGDDLEKAALRVKWPIRVCCFYETVRDPFQITSKRSRAVFEGDSTLTRTETWLRTAPFITG